MLLIWALIVILAFFTFSSIEVVKQNTVYVVEFFGKFSRILTPGLNIKLPIFEKIVEKVTLKQQNFSIKGRYPSKDAVVFNLMGNLIFSVIPTKEGVQKYVYTLVERDWSIQAALENSLRTYISKSEREKILENKEELDNHIKADLQAQFKDWGIKIISFQILEINVQPNII